jgi:hypothetical protein
MVTPALILHWMFFLVPLAPHSDSFEETAKIIADVANAEPDALDAAATLTAIGYYESHFDPLAISKDSDPTLSYGIFQVSTQWMRFPASIRAQAETALRLVRDSWVRCGTLAEYTSGSCREGVKEAADRAKVAYRLKALGWYFEDNVIQRKRRKERICPEHGRLPLASRSQ